MTVTFHGAAETVTGSKHLLTLKNGTHVLLDCGMFQGHGKEADTLNHQWGFSPATIKYVILSHAHIDHCGLVPKLVKDGFKGKIVGTPATLDLTAILLLDSARLKVADAQYINKKREREGKKPIQPLYDEEDIHDSIKLFHPIPYNTPYQLDDSIELTFYNAGHIIGAATSYLKVKEDEKITTIAYSGDVGRFSDPIICPPQAFPQADYIIVESTYGNRQHGVAKTYANRLKQLIDTTCLEKGGKLIIPAFSVGRTQELLFALNELELTHRLPAVSYYVDSPLSVEATEATKRHPECMNDLVKSRLKIDPDTFYFQGCHYIKDIDESKALNTLEEPCVIISASGMAEAGRVKHHIANSIEQAQNTIVLMGYCDPRSLGGKLKQGYKEVSIFGETLQVNADIESIDSMSAHADYNDLIHYLSCQNARHVKRLFVVHGEPDVQEEFRDRLLSKGFSDVYIPKLHEAISL